MGIFDTPNPTLVNLAGSSATTYQPWYEQAAQGAYGGLSSAVAAANAAASQPYAGAGGVALTPSLEQDQLAAFEKIRGNAGAWQPGFTQAGQLLGDAQGRIGQTYTPQGIATGQWGNQADVNRYMNPYIQNVLDVGARNLNTQFDIQQQKANDQAAMAGAFGGSRQGVLQGQIEKARGQQLSDLYATGLGSAYQNAQQMFTADQARGLTAQTADEAAKARAAGLGLQAGALGLQGTQVAQQLGLGTQAAGLTDANALLGVGNQLYNRQQQSITNEYNDWLRRQQAPIQNAQALLQGLGAARTGSMTATTNQQAIPGVSTASQLGGLGVTALGGLGLLNQSGLLSGLGNTVSSGIGNISSAIGNMFNTSGFAPSAMDFSSAITPDLSYGYFSKGGRVERRGLGFARGGLVEGVRRFAMGRMVTAQQISRPGVRRYADGGGIAPDGLDAEYLPQGPTEMDREAGSLQSGSTLEQTIQDVVGKRSDALQAGNRPLADAYGSQLQYLYAQLKARGPSAIVGSPPEVPANQIGGNTFGGYRTDGSMARRVQDSFSNMAPSGPNEPLVRGSINEVPYGLPGSGAFSDLKQWLGEKPGLPSSVQTATGEDVQQGRRAPVAVAPYLPGGGMADRLRAYVRGEGAQPTGIAAVKPANVEGAAVAGAGAEVQPMQDEPTGEPLQQSGIARATAAPQRSGSIAGARPRPAVQANEVASVEDPLGGDMQKPQVGIAAAAPQERPSMVGPSTPPAATAEKPFEPLKSGWMPVIQAGLRMMAAKPGQSFVQNLGEAGQEAVKGLEAQVKAGQEEKKLGLEERKVAATEMEAKVKAQLAPGQLKYFEAHADQLRDLMQRGKWEVSGVTPDGKGTIMRNVYTNETKNIAGLPPQVASAIIQANAHVQAAAMQDRDKVQSLVYDPEKNVTAGVTTHGNLVELPPGYVPQGVQSKGMQIDQARETAASKAVGEVLKPFYDTFQQPPLDAVETAYNRLRGGMQNTQAFTETKELLKNRLKDAYLEEARKASGKEREAIQKRYIERATRLGIELK